MRDNNDMAHTAQFDRAQEAEAAESCARPVAGVRTPEETAAALRARLAANHANTLAYVACLKACTGNQRPYREVEEELIGHAEEIHHFGDVLFIMIEASNLWGQRTH